MGNQPKPSQEDIFKETLAALVQVATAMSPYCETVEEFVGMANLALENPGQMRLLMDLVQQKK